MAFELTFFPKLSNHLPNLLHRPLPRSRTFPRVTKCEFQRYGLGGDFQSDDYLCVLAPNIVSEKIFVFLWFWYCVLAAVAVANLVLVLGMACRSATVRGFYMKRAVYSRKVGSC